MPTLTAGSEILVNSTTSGNQSAAQIAQLAGGRFIVVWTDYGATGGDTSGAAVRGQLYDASGAPVGSEFQVNVNTVGDQYEPKVTGLADGSFVITWSDNTGDASSAGVKARIYDSSGSPTGSEFLVNTITGDQQWQPCPEALPGGGFVVTWAHRSGDSSLYAVKGQIFDGAGAKVGAEFLVNTTELFYQDNGKAAALAGGGFVVVWNDFSHTGGDSSGYSVKGQIFDDSGAKIGGEFLVNTTTSADQAVANRSVTALPGGGFVVVWQDNSGAGGDSSGWSIRGQMFDSSGAKVGGEFLVNTNTAGDQTDPVTALLPDGGFIVGWQDSTGDGSGLAVKGQMFDPSGAPVGGEFLINATTAGNQYQPGIAALSSGFAIAWTDDSGAHGDSSGTGITLRLFSTANVIDGTPGDDALIGTPGDDTINGFAGNDFIQGRGGDDTLYGGDGDDLLQGDAGELYTGPSGNDTLYGENGNDSLRGGLGNDQLYGGDGNDHFRGGAGVDSFDGGADDGEGFNGIGDRISFYEQRATQGVVADLRTGIISNDGYGNVETMVGIESLGGDTAYVDTFYGNDGRNFLFGSRGDNVFGFGGDDLFQISSAPATLDGGADTDTVFLTSGGGWLMPDTNADGVAEIAPAAPEGWFVNLGTGAMVDGYGNFGTVTGIENVVGSELADTIRGDNNNNVLQGGGGDDVVIGNGGDDTVDGGDGSDFLRGDAQNYTGGPFGNDIIIGGAGDDHMRGGPGVDSFDGGTDSGGESIYGGIGDRISFFEMAATAGVVADLRTGIISNDGFGNVETMTGIESLGGDTAYVDTFYGNDGRNTLLGGRGDNLYGFGGDDNFSMAAAAATVDGGAGTDTLQVNSAGGWLMPDTNFDGIAEVADAATDGWFINLLTGQMFDGYGNFGTVTGIENVDGSELADAIRGDNGNNVLSGLGGDDLLVGNGGDDTLIGGDGDDILRGEAQNYTGGPFGNDILIVGAGDDQMRGGPGTDSFDGGTDSGVENPAVGFGDRISFYERAATAGVVADLRTGIISNDGFGNVETMVNIESLGAGTAFADIFYGNDGRNFLFADHGDSAYGFGGDDIFQLGSAPALADGGSGIDRLTLTSGGGALLPDADADGIAETQAAAAAGWTVNLAAGTVVDGYGNSGAIAGFENVDGSEHDDTLIGDSNNNVLNGLDGNDTLQGNGGDDTLDGGNGTDTASYANASSGVNVNLGAGFANGADGNDTLISIENAIGSAFDDVLVGSNGDNVLEGRGGNDFLQGGQGNDTLDGGEGNDFVVAGQGADTILGGAGGDNLNGQQGNDTIYGGDGHDAIFGQGGDDTIYGGDGDDFIRGDVADGLTPGNDYIDAGAGFDRVTYYNTHNAVTVDLNLQGVAQDTGQGMDILLGTEAISGSVFSDTLIGDNNDNWFFIGGAGVDHHTVTSDTISGNGGNDLIVAGLGNHNLDGGTGTDTLGFAWVRTEIFGGVTVDLTLQGAAQDTGQGSMTLTGFENLSGSMFDDTLSGDAGSNTLAGNAGSDLLRGGAGDDVLLGDGEVNMAETNPAGAGAPTTFNSRDYSAVDFYDSTGTIVYLFEGQNLYDSAGNLLVREDLVDEFGGPFSRFTLGGTTYDFYAGQATTSDGVVGNDTLEGGAGSDILNGGGGSDTASYATATGRVEVNLPFGFADEYAPDGVTIVSTDTLVSIENAIGSAFDDTLIGNDGVNLLYGGDGADFIQGGGGNDQVFGGDGNDNLTGDRGPLFAGPSGDDLVDGGAGNDAVRGRAGNDTVLGGAGNDFVEGGTGNDLIDGGSGFDRAAFYSMATTGVHVDLNLQGVAQDTNQGMDTLINIENVSGSQFGDTLIGDDNDNQLWGSPATLADGITISPDNNDTLIGNGGNDLLTVGIGNHSLTGGTGTDTVSFTENGNPEPALTISLGLQGVAQATGAGSWTLNGIENLSGGIANDHLTGDSNANVLAGNTGNDTLVGGAGNDTLYGDGLIGIDNGGTGTSGPITTFADVTSIDPALVDGDDTLEGGLGDDTLNGGGGIDTATYAHASGGVDVDLAGGLTVGADGTDTLVSIENVTGSEFDDSLFGDGGDNALDGLGGADFIQGRAGNDILHGGDGDDFLRGDAGDGFIGFGGNDTLYGENGNDSLRGGLGNDQMYGGANNDLLRGNGGVDYFDGGSDDGEGFNGIGDRVSFFEVRATQGAVADLRTGIISNDGFGNVETMTGIESLGGDTAYADTFYGNDGRNYLFGNVGDSIYGFGGDDIFQLSSATAVVDGGLGSDRLVLLTDGGWLMPDTNADGLAEMAAAATSGWTVNLTAGTMTDGYGNAGSVTGIENVDGSTLADTLIGDANANILNGLDGNDTLNGRGGNDTLNGGGGTDTASYANASGGMTVSLTAGTTSGADGADTLIGIENVTGSAFADTITGDANANVLSGGNGNDTLNGLLGNDTLIGDGGTDTASYANASGAVSVNLTLGTASGADGADTLATIENVTGSNFADTITGDANANALNGGDGGDTLNGRLGNDALNGGNGIDTASYADASGAVTVNLNTGSASGADGTDTLTLIENVTGSAFADMITGDANANVIKGGDGADTILAARGDDLVYGGRGNDTMSGSQGNDRYVMEASSGSDTVTDFVIGNDKIVFDPSSGVTSFSQLTITKVGSDARVSWAGGNSVLLQGVKASALTASDFQFGSAFFAAAETSSSSAKAALIGAIAAVGLDAAHSLGVSDGYALQATTSAADTPLHNQALVPIALEAAGLSDSSALFSQAVDGPGIAHVDSAIFVSPGYSESGLSMRGSDNASAQGPAELLPGTAMAPQHLAMSVPFGAPSLAIPAAAQLGGLANADGAPAQHNQIVAQVLADALHGGDAGPIDALIESLPSQPGASPLGALANMDLAHDAGMFGMQALGESLAADPIDHAMATMTLQAHI